MKKDDKSNTVKQQQSKPPRFEASISEEKFNQTIINCQDWDSARLIMLTPLTKDSEALLEAYKSDTSCISDEWVATMNILYDYRDHLVQCMYMLSAALERVSMIGEYLAEDMNEEEQGQPIAPTFHGTIH
ncbi:hypothetical protein JWJ90_17040 [Desulfobulbus rhabdoformis]|uniref:hypothetical protein n=1 Tax=Desulfobulbus rhabdoformis TaxID=34032 RepID=UPI00196368C8|nr:hypothetical protein [Desulfobulbus rhabdoformis]MBM9615977.1 hypothetical protein [Desulfobulbus rhabdoformis]